MSANSALPILLTLLVALLPIAIYCMVLVSINRRPTPMLVSGVWDFAGVLFAVSGIVLWTGPALLATLYQRSVASEGGRTFESVWLQWWFIWAAYYGVVTAGGVFLLWLRRPTTAIYNVQTDQVTPRIEATLRHLGFEFAHHAPRQFLISPVKTAPVEFGEATALTAAPTRSLPSNDTGPAPFSTALEVDVFAPMSHATLTWYETGPCLRDEVETELRKTLVNAGATDNAAAMWQSGVCILLFGAIFLCVVFVVLGIIFPRH